MSVKIQPYYTVYCCSNTSHRAQYRPTSDGGGVVVGRVKILYYYVVLLLKSRVAVGKVDPTCVRVSMGGMAGRGWVHSDIGPASVCTTILLRVIIRRQERRT